MIPHYDLIYNNLLEIIVGFLQVCSLRGAGEDCQQGLPQFTLMLEEAGRSILKQRLRRHSVSSYVL